MTAFQWWRSWHDAPTDHKWAVVAARSGSKPGIVSAVAWALFDYASQHENRGTVTGFDTETYAVFSGFPENEVIQIIQAMTDKKIIIDGRLANWEKRQPKREDDSYGRVTKFREKKRIVTPCNADEEDVTLRLDKDKDKDTDTDKDKDKEQEQSLSLSWPPTEPNAFALYETEIGELTPTVGEMIGSAIDEYSAPWVEDAIKQASISNVRKWTYCIGILQNWKTNGRDNGSKGKGKPKLDEMTAEQRAARYAGGEFSDYVIH